MSELRDFSMGSEEAPPPEGRRPRGPLLLLAAGVLVLAVVLFLWWRGRGKPEESAPQPAAPAAESLPAEDAEALETPEVDLPTLDASDPWVREVVGQLSSHPKLASWLLPDELLRRFAAVVDNVASGASPRPHVPFLAPRAPFEVHRIAGEPHLSEASYQRYDELAAVIGSLDVEGTAALYRSVKPLLQQSLADLGYPDRDFDDVLAEAIRRVLETPVLEQEPALVAGVSSYEFADPRLENLSAAQKHFLRMGPDNLRRVQATARQLAAKLGLDVT